MKLLSLAAALAALAGTWVDAWKTSALDRRLSEAENRPRTGESSVVAAADPWDDPAYLELENLRAEIAGLRLELDRLRHPLITTEERLQREVAAHLLSRDRDQFVRAFKRSIDGLSGRVEVHLMDISRGLQLTEQQEAEMRKLLDEFIATYRERTFAASLDRPVEAEMEEVFRATETRLRAVLSEEQSRRWTGLPRGWLNAEPSRKH